MDWMQFPSLQLERLSFLPSSAFFVAVMLLAVNLALSLTHATQELRGRMWRYVGAIAGVRIPDVWGVAFFFVGLTLVLVTVGVLALVGLPLMPDYLRMAAVGTMVGMRLSDSWFLHAKLDREGYRPNPGLPSVPLYVVEAVFLAVLFSKGVLADVPSTGIGALIGFAFGALFFVSVLPIVGFLGKLLPGLKDQIWQPGSPMPSSASTS